MFGFLGRGVYKYTTMTQGNCLAFRDWLEATYPGLTRIDTVYKADIGGYIWANVAYAQGWIVVLADPATLTCEIAVRIKGQVLGAASVRNQMTAIFGLSRLDGVVPWHCDTTQDGDLD